RLTYETKARALARSKSGTNDLVCRRYARLHIFGSRRASQFRDSMQWARVMRPGQNLSSRRESIFRSGRRNPSCDDRLLPAEQAAPRLFSEAILFRTAAS